MPAESPISTLDPAICGVTPECVERARAGDTAAFRVIFECHYGDLYRYLGYKVGAADADDLIIDIFSALWRMRRTMPAPAPLRRYLLTAAKNRFLTWRLRPQNSNRILSWDSRIRSHHVVSDQSDNVDGDDGDTTYERAAAVFMQALEQLDDDERVTVALRWGFELSYAEIAYLLGVKVRHVESRISRVLRALRGAWAQTPEVHD